MSPLAHERIDGHTFELRGLRWLEVVVAQQVGEHLAETPLPCYREQQLLLRFGRAASSCGAQARLQTRDIQTADVPAAWQSTLGPQVVAVVDLHVASTLVGDLCVHFPAREPLAEVAALLVLALPHHLLVVQVRLEPQLRIDIAVNCEILKHLGHAQIAVELRMGRLRACWQAAEQ